jgi:hypothetical protein
MLQEARLRLHRGFIGNEWLVRAGAEIPRRSAAEQESDPVKDSQRIHGERAIAGGLGEPNSDTSVGARAPEVAAVHQCEREVALHGGAQRLVPAGFDTSPLEERND